MFGTHTLRVAQTGAGAQLPHAGAELHPPQAEAPQDEPQPLLQLPQAGAALQPPHAGAGAQLLHPPQACSSQ